MKTSVPNLRTPLPHLSPRLSPIGHAARLLACGALTGLLLPHAFAADEKKGGEASQLDTVVVTAQKRSESIKEVPMSVEVVDPEKLSSQGMVKLADFYTQVPGLTFVQSAMSGGIMMRGIGTTTGLTTRPTAGFVVDDVAYGSATNSGVVPDLDPSDLKQIEVLRGPQGTLYGASSMGGLVKYVLNDADPRRATRRVEIGASDTDHGGQGYTARFAMNQPLGENIAIRVSAFKRRDPGYIKNLNDPSEDGDSTVQGGRIAAFWKLSDRVTVKLSSITQDTKAVSSNVQDVNYALQPIGPDDTHTRAVGNDDFHGRSSITTLKIGADLGFAMLDSITGYNDHVQHANQDVSYTAIGSAAFGINMALGLGLQSPGAVIDNRFDSTTKTQEVRLSSKDGDGSNLQWLLGAYYSQEKSHTVQNFYLAEKKFYKVVTEPGLLANDTRDTYTSKAVFGDASYKFTPQFDVQVGLRRAEGRNSSHAEAGGILSDPIVSDDANTDKVTTYLFSPRYKVSKNLMTYFRAASGFRPGGSNGAIPGATWPLTYKSDKLNSYELGAKTTLQDYGISIDAALFRIDWSDIQLIQKDLTFGSSYTINGSKARSDGLELSGTWLPSNDWRLTLAYAYNDAKLTQDIPGFVQGSTAYGRSGDALPYSAKNTLALSATRFFNFADGYEGFGGLNYNYVGGRLMEFEQSSTLPRISLPSYQTFGLNAGVNDGNWTLTLYVRNLNDVKGYTNASRRAASVSSGTAATLGAAMIQPRTVGFTLAWNL